STFSFLIIFSRLYSYFLNLVFSGQIIKAPALYECDEAGAGGRAFSSFLSVDLLSVVGEGVAATSALYAAMAALSLVEEDTGHDSADAIHDRIWIIHVRQHKKMLIIDAPVASLGRITTSSGCPCLAVEG
ncbi:hypothetical protein LINPERPRIM_LOCUS21966, partial [Linum perenne]